MSCRINKLATSHFIKLQHLLEGYGKEDLLKYFTGSLLLMPITVIKGDYSYNITGLVFIKNPKKFIGTIIIIGNVEHAITDETELSACVHTLLRSVSPMISSVNRSNAKPLKNSKNDLVFHEHLPKFSVCHKSEPRFCNKNMEIVLNPTEDQMYDTLLNHYGQFIDHIVSK